jgi:hypothetical protein
MNYDKDVIDEMTNAMLPRLKIIFYGKPDEFLQALAEQLAFDIADKTRHGLLIPDTIP